MLDASVKVSIRINEGGAEYKCCDQSKERTICQPVEILDSKCANQSKQEKILLQAKQHFHFRFYLTVRYGGWREQKMVFFRGKVGDVALEEAEHHRGQGGELPPASSQLHPRHGPKIASVSVDNLFFPPS